ncbi:histidine phosphatase family protein [Arthrobacter sp. B3I4]|uniref:histidine phosphatase family protein n=1 Tax=Arthrobacter sp. B3I4 TaxID=3042267 RepID=UPI00277FC7EC|nr:histidine phosphatase family protein [Arthrobacter sp. B3I4]MDQ0754666.1 broad specificity phosphatase PhoE [Arthrobacter sp. B3I4]
MGSNGSADGSRTGITGLVLIRHGESEGNVAATQAREAGAHVINVPARDADVGLSGTGREQALALGRLLAGVPEASRGAVWSSPYARARQTAELALQTGGWRQQIGLDERLRDRELGILDMLTSAGVEARFPEEAQRRRWLGKFYYRPPGGESWADVVLRLRSLLAELDREHPGEEVLLVCHDALIMLFRYILQQLTESELLDLAATTSVLNASVSRFVRPGGTGSWELESFNLADHLTAHGVPVTEHAGDASVHPR